MSTPPVDRTRHRILMALDDSAASEKAIDYACELIAGQGVGRNSLPWYSELFHHHPADELVRRAHVSRCGS